MNQRLSILDPANSGHDGKEMSEKEICRMVVFVVILGPANLKLQKMAQAQ